ncbi:MAG: 23S rRNA (adenine(2503)-C(2))-methyltransferase RlmN [Lachnospiraceae bacterium]|jgi:23S rRNA (adenine2503-C2)-methyltransferase
MDKADISSMTRDELENFFVLAGEKKFRAAQVFNWIHGKHVHSFEEMSNLPESLRQRLDETARLTDLEMVKVQVSKIDGTAKYLFRLADNNVIESVLMHYHHGNSVCISSQVGCAMGCRFCASTLGGCVRSLTAAEMCGQVYKIAQLSGERVDSVVVMGSGEPFENFDAFCRFVEIINDPQGYNLSRRAVTVSTCGIVEKIRELADRKTQVTLAVSLHAPNDEIRRKLMPIAKRYTIDEILDACRYFFEKTGRRVSFEYSLAAGINDSLACADELAARLAGFPCHVNLIPVNPVRERTIRQSAASDIQAFKRRLEKHGVNVTIRREMGRDIDGACGQLRKSYLDESGSSLNLNNSGGMK